MLLVSRSGLVEEDAVQVFHYYGFHLSSSFLMYNFKSWVVDGGGGLQILRLAANILNKQSSTADLE